MGIGDSAVAMGSSDRVVLLGLGLAPAGQLPGDDDA